MHNVDNLDYVKLWLLGRLGLPGCEVGLVSVPWCRQRSSSRPSPVSLVWLGKKSEHGIVAILERRFVVQRHDPSKIYLKSFAVLLQTVSDGLRTLAQHLRLAFAVVRAAFEHERHIKQISPSESCGSVEGLFCDDLYRRFRCDRAATDFP